MDFNFFVKDFLANLIFCKIVLFLAPYLILKLAIINNISRKVINRANSAKKFKLTYQYFNIHQYRFHKPLQGL